MPTTTFAGRQRATEPYHDGRQRRRLGLRAEEEGFELLRLFDRDLFRRRVVINRGECRDVLLIDDLHFHGDASAFGSAASSDSKSNVAGKALASTTAAGASATFVSLRLEKDPTVLPKAFRYAQTLQPEIISSYI